MTLTYKNTGIRYSIIAAIFVLLFLKRNDIIVRIEKIKNDK